MAKPLASMQFELLREVFDLARAQRASLERDDLDEVLALMGERQAIIERLARLATESAGGAEAHDNVVSFPGVEDHTRQDALALDTVIRGILEHDRQNEALLFEKIQQVRGELPRLQHSRRAASAYRPASERGALMSRSS